MEAPGARRIPLIDGYVDLDRHEVRRGGDAVKLSLTEAKLVAWLADHPDTTHTRDQLLIEVWGYRPGVRSRTVDTTVQRLRTKIEADPADPTHLITVYGVGYRFELQRGASVTAAPTAATAFFGRSEERATLQAWLDGGARLVSLVGPGGIGKTRLALRLMADHHPAWFCDASAASTGWDVIRAVAGPLGVRLQADLDLDGAARTVARALSSRPGALVVLDNAESALDDVRGLVRRWHAQGDTRWVITSREQLGIDAERVLEVPPLDEGAALALLEDRARTVRPSFRVEACRDDAVALVRALDLQPLPIELAAARLDLLAPHELTNRLSSALDLLSRQAGPERHRTLRAVIDHSWGLLDGGDRDALCTCAVFAGPFLADAGEAVLGPDALDRLRSLKRRSLLRAEPVAALDGELRFSLYAGVREYAAERLSAWDGRGEAEERHRRFILDTAAALVAQLPGPDGVDAFRRLVLLADELLAVVQRDGVSHPEAAATAVLRLEPHMTAGVPIGRGLELVDRALVAARASGSALVEGDVLRMRGVLRSFAALMEPALRDVARARDLARHAGSDRLLIQADIAEGSIRCRQGRLADAETAFGRALDAARDADDMLSEARALHGMGVVRRMHGHFHEAEEHYLAALQLYRALGDTWYALATLGSLSNAYLDLGRYPEAERTRDEALVYARAFDDRVCEAVMLGNGANHLLLQNRLAESEAAYRDALEVARGIGWTRGDGYTLGGLGTIEALTGRTDEAVVTLELAAHAHREASNRPAEIGVLADRARLQHLRGELADARRVFEHALGLLDRYDAPVHRWRILAGLAAIAAEQGDAVGADALLERAREGIATVDDPVSPMLMDTVEAFLDWGRLARAEAAGDEVGARRFRQQVMHRLASVNPQRDLPTGAEWPLVAVLLERLRALTDHGWRRRLG